MGGCLSCRLKLVRDKSTNEVTLPENLTSFSFKSLKKATKNFKNRTSWDGSSSSYKGSLDDGSIVTVVVYTTENRHIDFTSIIKIVSGVKHKNVVEFIGYCIEDNHRLLVHEFIGDYSLDELLFSKSKVKDAELDWARRVSICNGISRALDYLHNGISPRVVVRDVKPRNVFIDGSFNPKIVGFENSCLLEDDKSEDSDFAMGTFGYLDPEFAIMGRYSEKTDVYAFGITLLEIISGRKCLHMTDHEDTSLKEWAWDLQENGRIPEMVDPTLCEFSVAEVIRVVNVALSCIQLPSNLRPSMSEVRLMLSDSYDLSSMVLNRPQRRSRRWVSENEQSDSSF